MRRFWILAVLLLLACDSGKSDGEMTQAWGTAHPDVKANATATFAGGCFWCIEAPFEKVPGVVEAVSGYTGGEEQNPTYQEVSGGTTGHTEAVQVHYDSTIVNYAQLVDYFWRQFDPTDAGGSFYDRGSQYRSGIFYHTEAQKQIAKESKRELAASGRFEDSIVTPIVPLDTFWVAEDYHQDYYKKSTRRYKAYREGSGRDAFIDRVWGDEQTPTWLEELRAKYSSTDEQ